jgi:alanyl-tRNA synthetase
MTERIYYLDAYCRTFDTRVARVLQHEGRPAVVLDRTAFYPTSGGQPFDVGRLGTAGVLVTIDLDDEIVHVTSQPLEVGAEIDAEIDWNRRFDHMQQHTGQHVLSAAFDRLFDNRTVGFHMGAEVSTIDLARDVTPDEVERAVDEANRIVWEDRPVTIRFASQEEASVLALRKESQREGILRLVEVADFDLSACGGTHVTSTGAIGMIAVLSGERVRGGLRVTFACGGRALTALRLYRDAVTGSVRSLSVLPAELPSAVERVQKEARDVRKQLKGLQDQLAVHEAARLAALAVPVGTGSLLVEIVNGWESAALKGLASAVTANRQVCAALLSPGPPVSIVLSCSAGATVDVNACLQELLRQFGGKGGGKRDLAQGGGLMAPVETIAAAARAVLESKLTSG